MTTPIPLRTVGGAAAIITGGSAGLGFSFAKALVARGARVSLVATDAARLQDAMLTLGDRKDVTGIAMNVADREMWPVTVRQAEDAQGPTQLLVLNAGAQGGRKPLEQIPPAEWDWVWRVNVDGIYNGLRACLPLMKSRDLPAHILITSSAAAFFPRANASAYGASKAAALAIGEALATELSGSRIGVSVFCPGVVRTSMNETMRRHAPNPSTAEYQWMDEAILHGREPDEVAEAALDQMLAGEFYILTHPELAPTIAPFVERRLAALGRKPASEIGNGGSDAAR